MDFVFVFFVITDSCKKTAIVFDDVVSSLEFINCQSVQGQVRRVKVIFKILFAQLHDCLMTCFIELL